MEFIRGLHNLRPEHRGCVMTIGNYDGVHLGHQAILNRLRQEADLLKLPLMVAIFEPTPREFFDPEGAPPRLSSLRGKLEDLEACGVDRVLCLHFNAKLAGLEAERFVQEVLVDGVQARVVAVGDDFRFGKNRRGDFKLLQEMSTEKAFKVLRLDTYQVDGDRVSSTRIRETLKTGDVRLAKKLLGKSYRISNKVRAGRKLGRTLGIPTANLALDRRKARWPAPRFGVYAVTVKTISGDSLHGVANLGVRPTVDGENCLLEVHLFDYEGDLYGQRLNVYFEEFIRDEARFESVEALKDAMNQDIDKTRAWFAASKAS